MTDEIFIAVLLSMTRQDGLSTESDPGQKVFDKRLKAC
jgi:hypothetical protein